MPDGSMGSILVVGQSSYVEGKAFSMFQSFVKSTLESASLELLAHHGKLVLWTFQTVVDLLFIRITEN